MTYSIVARDPGTGCFGVAVHSHFLAVGAHVPSARAGVGAVASQANGSPAYRRDGLRLMTGGASASEALAACLANDGQPDVRQVAMIDAAGRTAAHTGAGCWQHAAHATRDGVSAQANMVASPEIPEAMVASFLTTKGPFVLRLLSALDAAETAGGDLRGRQSASVLVVGAEPTEHHEDGVLLDLRVDDDDEPLTKLRHTVEMALAFEPMWEVIRGPACRGPVAPSREASARAIQVLGEAQSVYGPGNVEPSFWRSVALWRAGRGAEALTSLDGITGTNPGWRELFADVTSRWSIP